MARHAGRVARIAGLLHLAQHSPEQPIDEATMRSALQIGEYLLAHGLEALTESDPMIHRARKWLGRRQESTLSQRDLQRGSLGNQGTAEQAQELADALIAIGALRRLPSDDTPRPGRPASPRYAINPHLQSAPRPIGGGT